MVIADWLRELRAAEKSFARSSNRFGSTRETDGTNHRERICKAVILLSRSISFVEQDSQEGQAPRPMNRNSPST